MSLVMPDNTPIKSKQPDKYIKEPIWAFAKPSVDINRPDLLLVLATDPETAKKEISKDLIASGHAGKVELLNHVPIMAAHQMMERDPDLAREVIAKLQELELAAQ